GRVNADVTGTYLLTGVARKGGSVLGQDSLAVSVPYSPEYLVLGRDMGLLRQMANAGSGVVLGQPNQAWSQPTLPAPVSTEIFWVLLFLVALLWPIDVAMRRLTASPQQLVRAAVALARHRAQEVESSPELAHLRGRLTELRQQTRGRRAGPQGPRASPADARD